VPQIMNPDLAQPGCFPRRIPHLMTEPVIRDMAIGVPRTRGPGVIFSAAAANSAVIRVGSPAVLAPAFRRVVGSEGAVPVLPAFLVRLGHSGRGRVSCAARPGSGLRGCLIGEEEVILAKALGCDVSPDLAGDLLAELEPPVLFVLGVILDQEPSSVGVVVLGEFDDGAADGQDAGLVVEVADPDFRQLTPAHPAFDVGLHQQSRVRVGQCLVQALKLGGGDDAAGSFGDRRCLHTVARVDGDHLVHQCSGEDGVEDRSLAVLDGPRRRALGLHVSDPLADLLGVDVAHLHRPEERHQVLGNLAGVVAANTGLELVMRQPLVLHVGLECLPAAPGVALLAGPDLGLFVLPGVVGVLLVGEGAR
jgi:hypothetical protein